MKRISLYFAAVISAAFAMCSCQPTGDDIVLELVKDDPSALLYTCDRQTVKIKMNSNRSWKASCTEEWIEIETTKGSDGEDQLFRFILFANPGYTYRTGEIVIKAGDRNLVLTVTQEPEIQYLVKENFNDDNLLVEKALPSGWTSIDLDKDGFGWRCWRNEETEQAYAYSASYDSYDGDLSPDNYMLTPIFRIPAQGFYVRWDAMGSDAEYLGDKYEVWVAAYKSDSPLVYLKKLCEEVTESATELTHHEYMLDDYVDISLCIVFRHFDSVGRSRVLITNVEITNSR
ncbi:MAG: choice-of-anchor J domain-containing protein [Bacteroidales bacterium]|nr:choice-of-anchor J domain-containing protein [Bacteroidales bacterium]